MPTIMIIFIILTVIVTAVAKCCESSPV